MKTAENRVFGRKLPLVGSSDAPDAFNKERHDSQTNGKKANKSSNGLCPS